MAKTKVTGVKVTRKNNKFTITWSWSFEKKDDSVTKQFLIIHPMWKNSKNEEKGAQKTITLSKSEINAKKMTVGPSDYGYLDLDEYFDGKNKALTKIQFVMYGETKKTKGYSEEGGKTFDFDKPPRPSLTKTKIDTYTRKFTWATSTTDSGKDPVWKVEWQTYLVQNPSVSTEEEMNKLMDRKSPDSHYDNDLTDYHQIVEQSGISTGSWLRIFRVRSVGAGGVSKWNLESQLYAKPHASTTPYAILKPNGSGTTMTCTGYFNNPNDASHKISQVEAQYVIDTPLSGMLPPSTGWTTGRTFDDYKGKSRNYTYAPTEGWDEKNGYYKIAVSDDLFFEECIQFDVPIGSVDTDKCFFFRVQNKYGDFDTIGPAVIAENGFGALTAPTLGTVTPNDETQKVSVTVTNNSDVPDSHIIVMFIPNEGNVASKSIPIGVITGSGQKTQVLDYPSGDYTCKGVGIFAHVGEVESDGTVVTTLMRSAPAYESGVLPKAPTSVSLSPTERVGVARVEWDWAWDDAQQAEVSWSDYEYAWESTEQPNTYTVSREHVNYLYITDLETGVPIYVRVRYINGFDDSAIYGPYSAQQSIILESTPNIPSLVLSKYVIPIDGETKATWVYTSNDGTEQQTAELAVLSGTTYTIIDSIEIGNEQYAYITPLSGWTTGSTYQICVRVWSNKGQPSQWSAPVSLAIADPLTCSITSTSLVTETIDIDGTDTRTVKSLKALPLTVNVSGANDTNTTSLLIRRAEAFHIERPDDNVFDGYKGETTALYEQIGDAQISIGDNALMFDDEAQYEMVATVSDAYGQSAQDTLEFEVHWTHQAVMPSATVTLENGIARIVPRASVTAGDVCDIYRLSADRPQRILTNGAFNTVYVDPYPTIGEHGGYRIVYKTVNGDYKTADGRLAWVDVSTNYINDKTLIDFGGEQVELYYNVDESNGWAKDFTQTKYLGGTIQGDWNVGVTQSGSLSAVAIKLTDQEMIDKMRKLANYAGVCHVRTIGGASYACDVQVSESIGHDKGKLIYNYSLTVNKVDPIGDEAVLYSEWVK